MTPEATLLGSLTIPGMPENLRAVRTFVADTLRSGHVCAETAKLLTSELVNNAIQHTASGRSGGMVTVSLLAIPGGVRAEVADEGGITAPVKRTASVWTPERAEDGRGLQLVSLLAARWSYCRDQPGTLTWFELTDET